MRARNDARAFCLSFWGLVLEVLLGGAGAAVGALLVADPQTPTRVKVMVGGASAVVGFFAVAIVAFGVFLLLAPVHQRNEARGELRRLLARTSRLSMLAEQYAFGRSLQERLVGLSGTAASPEELRDADRDARRAVCEWAQGAWRLTREHFPAHEQEFYGPGTRALGDWGFALSCREELDQAFYGSPDNYLEAKLGLIARLLDKYDDGNRP